MIDTIKLILDKTMFWITDISLFQKEIQNATRGYFTLVQNPTKSQLLNGIYKPRLTLTKRFNCTGRFERTLLIELSLAKLLFGNNFDEVQETDFDLLVATLHQKLKEMGVLVFTQTLVNALVSAVHYSKNIVLTDGSTPYMYLDEIRKTNITQRLDSDEAHFKNEGHGVKFHTNWHELIFYDKLKEMQRAKISEKRAIEKDNFIQMGLFEEIQELKQQTRKPFEVMRMEARLNQRQKIRQVFKKIGLDVEPTFKNLFKKDIAQKVLLYYLDEVEASYPKTLYFSPQSDKDFLAQFLIDNPKAKVREPLLALGFHSALKEIGTREIRELLKKHPTGSWYRFYKQINSFNYPKNRISVFEPIRSSISEFKPFKLVDFQAEMLNNDKYV